MDTTTNDAPDLELDLDMSQDAPESAPDTTEDAKSQKREGFQMRQLQKQLDALKAENEGYKRRAEDERQSKLTEEQRIKEERDQFAQEIESLRRERLQQKIAAEFKLPPALSARLIGTDEDALRDDAAELAKLLPKPKIGNVSNPIREAGQTAAFKRSQLRDPAFYRANEAAIIQAYKDGRIEND